MRSYRERNGSERGRTVKKNESAPVQARYIGALERLEAQLISGTKPEKKTNAVIPLTEKDITRIKKEIGILQNKII